MTAEATAWAERNEVRLTHRFPLLLEDEAPRADTGQVYVEIYLLSARHSAAANVGPS